MEYKEALEWLQKSITFGICPGLQRITKLLEMLDNPERDFKSIHVAGTNGKGSVVAMITSVLKESGIRVGRYISPHLLDYTERISISGEDISKEDFATYLGEVKNAVEQMEEAGVERPTEFEILTAVAFLYFSRQACEYVVIEVGLGGTLDSTNVILPELSVITNVSFDHMQYCGDTINEIAEHKSGIIKESIPVVTAARGDALQVIKKKAREKHARLYYWGKDFSIDSRSQGRHGQILTLKRGDLPKGMLFVPFFGVHQAVNASVAAMAVTVLAKNETRITEDHLREGIAKAYWPGRFEVYGEDIPIILDGAHNVDGATALKMALDEQYPGKKRIFLFASLEDKDLEGIISELFTETDVVIAIPAPTDRSRTPESVVSILPCQGITETSVISGIKKAKEIATTDSIICVCGSLYILGEARQLLNNGNK